MKFCFKLIQANQFNIVSKKYQLMTEIIIYEMIIENLICDFTTFANY